MILASNSFHCEFNGFYFYRLIYGNSRFNSNFIARRKRAITETISSASKSKLNERKHKSIHTTTTGCRRKKCRLSCWAGVCWVFVRVWLCFCVCVCGCALECAFSKMYMCVQKNIGCLLNKHDLDWASRSSFFFPSFLASLDMFCRCLCVRVFACKRNCLTYVRLNNKPIYLVFLCKYEREKINGTTIKQQFSPIRYPVAASRSAPTNYKTNFPDKNT